MAKWTMKVTNEMCPMLVAKNGLDALRVSVAGLARRHTSA